MEDVPPPTTGRRDVREKAAQPLWRRSWKIPVAMSPQICRPPLVRSPVQMMISVRPGRIASTSSRETTMRFALRLRRLGSDGTDIAIEQRLEALDHEAVLAVEAVAEVVNEVGPGGALKRFDRLHGRFLRRADGGERRPRLSFDRRPPIRSRPDSDSRRRGTYRPGQGRSGVHSAVIEEPFAIQSPGAPAAGSALRSKTCCSEMCGPASPDSRA